MSDKITVIEGPTPVFQAAHGIWSRSLTESPFQHDTIFTELRAFDGEALVERCLQAWKSLDTIHLEYRNEDGLTDQLPIVAAYNKETEEGDRLQLWLRLEWDEVEIEIEYTDGDDDLNSPF